jgi:hypothetical protein
MHRSMKALSRTKMAAGVTAQGFWGHSFAAMSWKSKYVALKAPHT